MRAKKISNEIVESGSKPSSVLNIWYTIGLVLAGTVTILISSKKFTLENFFIGLVVVISGVWLVYSIKKLKKK